MRFSRLVTDYGGYMVVQYMVSSQGCTPYRDCDRPAALAT